MKLRQARMVSGKFSEIIFSVFNLLTFTQPYCCSFLTYVSIMGRGRGIGHRLKHVAKVDKQAVGGRNMARTGRAGQGVRARWQEGAGGEGSLRAK